MRTRVFIALAASVLGAAALVTEACSSFNEADVDAPDAPSEVATPPRDDADVADAGPDAADATDARFCAQHLDAELCADFDEGKAYDQGFTGHIGTAPSVDTDAFFSPPGSLLVTTTSLGYVEYTPPSLATSTTFQHLEFEVLIDKYPNTSGIVGSVDLGGLYAPSTGCTFDIEYADAGSRLGIIKPGDGGGNVNQSLSLAFHPEIGKWSRIDLTLTQDGAGVTVELLVDGASAIPPFLTFCPVLADKPEVLLGVYYPSTASIHYDDVFFERH